jgi:hypothetical protein
MRPGQFAGTLLATAPTAVRRQIRDAVAQRDGAIVVFPTRVQNPAVARATWVGFLTQSVDEGGFAGHGWPGQLQAANGIGYHIATPVVEPTWVLANWVEFLTPYNGIFQGSVTGSSIIASVWPIGLGAREFLDLICQRAQSGVPIHWRISQTGRLDVLPPGNLYPEPSVLVTADHDSEQGSIRGVKGAVVGVVSDASTISGQVVAFGQGSGGAIPVAFSTSSDRAWDINGAATILYRTLNLPSTPSGASLTNEANRVNNQNFEQRRSFDVAVAAGGHIERRLKPGDPLYVHDPELGIVGAAPVNGLPPTVRPVKVWTSQIDWSTASGQGVFLLRRNVWTDLSRWVEPGDGSARLTVSTDVDAALPSGSPNRLEPDTSAITPATVDPATRPMIPTRRTTGTNQSMRERQPGGQMTGRTRVSPSGLQIGQST